jgi:hypothetical protein
LAGALQTTLFAIATDCSRPNGRKTAEPSPTLWRTKVLFAKR